MQSDVSPLSNPARGPGFSTPVRFVLFWIGFQTVLAGAGALVLIAAPGLLLDPAVPDLFELPQWIAMLAGPPVVFWMLLRRVRHAEFFYLSYVLLILASFGVAEIWSPFLTSAETYGSADGLIAVGLFAGFTLVDMLALVILFRARGNGGLRPGGKSP